MIFNWRRYKELINATLRGDLFAVTIPDIAVILTRNSATITNSNREINNRFIQNINRFFNDTYTIHCLES